MLVLFKTGITLVIAGKYKLLQLELKYHHGKNEDISVRFYILTLFREALKNQSLSVKQNKERKKENICMNHHQPAKYNVVSQ